MWNKRTVSVVIIGILSVIVGVGFMEANVGSDLADYPFWHVVSLAIPIIGGAFATYWAFEWTDSRLYGFWDFVKQIGLFLLPPIGVALAIGLAFLLLLIFVTTIPVLAIWAIVGGGGAAAVIIIMNN